MNPIPDIEIWLKNFSIGKLGIAADYIFDYRQYASVMATLITEERDHGLRDANVAKLLKVFAEDITRNCPPEGLNYLQEALRMIAICWG